MDRNFIFMVFKMALYNGNTIKISTRNGIENTRILNYEDNKLFLVKGNLNIEKNESVSMQIYYNGEFKLLGICNDVQDSFYVIDLDNDFQYITKRKNVRIPVFFPIEIDSNNKGVIVDFNADYYIGIVTFSKTKKKDDKINIKFKNYDKLIMCGSVIIVREEVFNMERLVIKLEFEDNENYAKKMFDSLLAYYSG